MKAHELRDKTIDLIDLANGKGEYGSDVEVYIDWRALLSRHGGPDEAPTGVMVGEIVIERYAGKPIIVIK